MPDPSTIGNVLYPASDVGAAIDFYGGVLGLPTKFRDGDRYAALDGGGVTLAIAGPEEDVAGGNVAASFRVTDVTAAVQRVEAAGGTVVRAAERGPHEIRAVVADPWGNPVVLYAKA
jgi:predicted enzyme related to lactoylglutathione lyase